MDLWDGISRNQALYRAPTQETSQQQAALLQNNGVATTFKPPPRSRSGCWTCRTRKVKCDEGRPKCHQCLRLNHDCDYSPKLAFKDETPKVVDKYIESSAGHGSWASGSNPSFDRHLVTEPDSLPPFTQLTNDEDWQQKAVHQPPGTYYVVANSGSFADSEEYKAQSAGKRNSASSRYSLSRLNANISVDDATLILGNFDEASKKSLHDANPSNNLQPTLLTPWYPPNTSTFSHTGSASMPLMDHRASDLLYHWRLSVRKQLFQLDAVTVASSINLEDLVEVAATSYLPLKHAMLALSSLSLATSQKLQTVQALEYYTKAIDALTVSHDDQELVSNGLFLTHWILLVYEIASTDRFWYSHMETLKAIIARRRYLLLTEPFASIVYAISSIDATALMSCSGEGALVLDLIQTNGLPTYAEIQKCPPILPIDPGSNTNWGILEPAFQFLRDLLILWTKLGQCSRRIRQEIQEMTEQARIRKPNQLVVITAHSVSRWNQEAVQLREAIKRKWDLEAPRSLMSSLGQQQQLMRRSRQLVEDASLLYHSSLIYSHTSMWPTQHEDIQQQPHDRSEIDSAASAILEIAQNLLAQQQVQQRAIVFGLFLAGFATTKITERVSAIELLRIFEETSLGNNTSSTRVLLEEVLRRRDEQRTRGLSDHVDWMLMAQELGLQHLVNFGF